MSILFFPFVNKHEEPWYQKEHYQETKKLVKKEKKKARYFYLACNL